MQQYHSPEQTTNTPDRSSRHDIKRRGNEHAQLEKTEQRVLD